MQQPDTSHPLLLALLTLLLIAVLTCKIDWQSCWKRLGSLGLRATWAEGLGEERGRHWKWVLFCLSPGVEHSCLPKHPSPQFQIPYSTPTSSVKHLLIDSDVGEGGFPFLVSFTYVFVSRGSRALCRSKRGGRTPETELSTRNSLCAAFSF